MAKLVEGQEVKVYGRYRHAPDGEPAEVTQIGRKYVTVSWGPSSHQQGQFDKETGYAKGDRYGNGSKIKTLEQAERDACLAEAHQYIAAHGFSRDYRYNLSYEDVVAMADFLRSRFEQAEAKEVNNG
jgi:hypothetical protein